MDRDEYIDRLKRRAFDRLDRDGANVSDVVEAASELFADLNKLPPNSVLDGVALLHFGISLLKTGGNVSAARKLFEELFETGMP